MIRRTVHLCLLVLALAALWAGVQLGGSLLDAWEDARRDGSGKLEGNEQRRIAYRLDTRAWTNFPSPAAGSTVRLVSHADLPANFAREGGRGTYNLLVRFQTRSGRTISERRIEVESVARFYRPQGGGGRRLLRFYHDRDAVPMETRESLVQVPETQPWNMQVRVDTRSAEVQGVHLRVYARESVSARQLDYLWERLTRAERMQLAADLVFPADLLQVTEQRNLVRNRWRPLGPRGVEGADFQVTVFYTLEGIDLIAERDPPAMRGLYADRAVRATLQVPDRVDRLRVQGFPLSVSTVESASALAGGLLRVWQAGRVFPVLRPFGEQDVVLEPPGTFVEVLARRPMRVKFGLPGVGNESGDSSLQEPRPAILAAYRLDRETPVVYPVRHVGLQPTLLRLDLRSVRPASEMLSASTEPVRVRFLSEAGDLLEEISWKPVYEHSLYDHVPGEPVQWLSEPVRAHWRLPADVRRVEISGAGHQLVAAYNRPAELVRTVVLPESDEEGVRTRTWFVLRPIEQIASRQSLLALGDRPPRRERQRDVEGRYLWEDFQPRGDVLTRDLLEMRHADTIRRPQLLPVFFVPVADGEHSIRLHAVGASGMVRPKLLFQNPGERASRVRLRVNGRTRFQGLLPPGQGVLPLGRLPAGLHQIELSAPGVAVHLNHRRVQGEGVLLRAAVRMARSVRRFPIRKSLQAAEVLSVRLYHPLQQVGAGRVRLQLVQGEPQTGGPFDSLTFPGQQVQLAGHRAQRVTVLGAQQFYAGFEPTYFQLGEDLPPGNYELEVAWPDGAQDGLVLMSRLLPGDYDVVRVFRQ